MIMPRGSDQLLLPVNPLFIGLTLIVALGLNMLPAEAAASAAAAASAPSAPRRGAAR